MLAGAGPADAATRVRQAGPCASALAARLSLAPRLYAQEPAHADDQEALPGWGFRGAAANPTPTDSRQCARPPTSSRTRNRPETKEPERTVPRRISSCVEKDFVLFCFALIFCFVSLVRARRRK